MGYISTVCGSIEMTEDAFEAVEKATFVPAGTISGEKLPPESIAEQFEGYGYEKGHLWIDSNGKHYELDAVLRVLSKIKDVDSIDAVKYVGEDSDDMIFYFIGKGFVAWFNPMNLMDRIFNVSNEHPEEFKKLLVLNKLEGNSTTGDIALSDDDMIKLIKEM
jgi:hypothetical protein